MNDEDIINKLGEWPAFTRGDVIFREGREIDGVYFLHTGRVALMKRYRSKDDVMVFVAEPGDILGFPGIINGNCYINSAIALSDVLTSFMPREMFLTLIRERPKIALRMMQRLSKRIDRVELVIQD